MHVFALFPKQNGNSRAYFSEDSFRRFSKVARTRVCFVHRVSVTASARVFARVKVVRVYGSRNRIENMEESRLYLIGTINRATISCFPISRKKIEKHKLSHPSGL